MKLQLTTYQEKAAHDLILAIDDAGERFDRNGRLSAISLTAVTGAGKTVIAAAALEDLLTGTPDLPANPNLTVVWLTDDPSLNVQTRRKMSTSSNRIKLGQLVTIDEHLDQRVLDPGKIYFLNIQKLGKGSSKFVSTGDQRQYGLWDILRQTIRERGKDFLLVIDEAHRGTSGTGNGERKTIASRLMNGEPERGAPPAPIVIGISATPERFESAVQGSGRLLDPVKVDIDAVRESGLIKDMIRLIHPTETQPSDMTLVAEAVRDVMAYDDQWAKYAASQNEPHVEPVLVIQVRPAVSDRDLGEILNVIHTTWPGLDHQAIGHSFQDHRRINLGERSIRYIAPQDIQDDPRLRVVLFKEALTTGWDCPRAEVMISLRSAADHTYIAQLIGRMIRTPLARRIPTSDQLNSVALYLPHYNSDTVDAVIGKLRSGDDQVASEITTNAVLCKRNTKVPAAVWEKASLLPTYTRPGKIHRSEVARLNTFAQLLASTGIDPEAIRKAKDHLIGTLDREASRLGAKLEKTVSDYERLDFAERISSIFETGDSTPQTTAKRTEVEARNIDDLFRIGKRKLGDAVAAWYWDELCERDEKEHGEADTARAKLIVAALAHDPTTVEAVETAAGDLLATWRRDHYQAITKLPHADRDKANRVFQQSKKPEQITVMLPDDINTSAPATASKYDKHLYANGGGKFPMHPINEWERKVLEQELTDAVAWYRNPSAGQRAVGVPYKTSTESKTMYPDFIFFYEEDGDIFADIIDPHDPSRADTAAKWLGLAEYAETHRDTYRRVLAVIKEGGDYLALDLRNATVKKELVDAADEAEVRRLFIDYGGKL